MSVDRLSVTVPSELGAALRSLADARGSTVSNVVTDAIAHVIRLAALDRALAEADAEFGVLSDEQVREAEAVLSRAAKRRRPKPHRRTR